MFSARVRVSAAAAALATVLAACSSPSADNSGGSADDETATAATEAAEELGIDLASCPSDPTEPFGAEVKVGMDVPMSGAGAAFAPIAAAARAMFANFNETSGLDTTFELVQRDSQFAPDRAAANMQQMVESDGIVAATSEIGTGQALAVLPIIQQQCVPLIPAAGNGVAVNDMFTYPWSMNLTILNDVDMRGYISHIDETFPGGAKIALFFGNTASGDDALSAVERYVEGTEHEVVSVQRIDAADAAAPSSQVTTMRNSGADVLIAGPTGAQCQTIMTEAARQGWQPQMYLYNGCPIQLFAAAGDAADGVYNIQNAIQPGVTDDFDERAAEIQAIFDEYEPGLVVNPTSLSGVYFAEAFLEAARNAAESELGLSRLGLMYAASHMSAELPGLDPRVTINLDRPDDDVAQETLLLNQFDASTGTFTNVSVIDLEGEVTESIVEELDE